MGGVEITGRSVACMVAADWLAQAGVPVRLTADGGLGRGFAPIKVDGHYLEAGARLLELSYDRDFPERTRVSPMLWDGGDHRQWMPLIRDYIVGLTDPVPAEVWVDRAEGMGGVDFLLSGDLRSLPSVTSKRERATIEHDAMNQLQIYPGGLDRRVLREFTYRNASVTLHGQAFHDLFIGPLLDTILGPGGDVPAVDHRKVWLPLFTPIEVLQGVWGESERPRHEFHFGMGAAVEALTKRVDPLREVELSHPVRTIVDAPRPAGRSVSLTLVWAQTTEADGVTWFYGLPKFRSTVLDGVRCDEFGGAGVEGYGPVLHLATADAPLVTSAMISPKFGVIGSGSFNEQVLQGLSAAAWAAFT